MSPNPKLTESPTPMKPTTNDNIAQSISADNSHYSKNEANSQTETETDQTDTYSETYFDALYNDNSDPWQYQTRWYEKRKRDICLAILPQAEYNNAIELGCGNGVFSQLLAQRCQALLSIDGNKNAVQLAKQRLEGVSHVKVLQGVIPKVLYSLEAALLEAYPNTCLEAFPIADEPSSTHSQASTHPFDLIVISEILYYLAPKDIDTVIEWIKQNLAVGGTLLCCHWRYDIDGFEMNGDTVHQRLQHALNAASHNNDMKQSEPKTEHKTQPDPKTQSKPKSTFTHQTQLVESDFLLDVWINSQHSVAMQENLV